MEAPPDFASAPGTPVPPVAPECLKEAFALFRTYGNMEPNDVAQKTAAIELARKAGGSLPAVSYRAMMLEILTRVPQAPLRPWTDDDGRLEDVVFWEVAQISMKWMPPGLSESFPFDLEELLRRVASNQQKIIQ